jgi:hypothetical protein
MSQKWNVCGPEHRLAFVQFDVERDAAFQQAVKVCVMVQECGVVVVTGAKYNNIISYTDYTG